MADHKVRTTFRPDVELVVGDAELADLTAQGLLVPAPKTPEPSPAAGKTQNKEA